MSLLPLCSSFEPSLPAFKPLARHAAQLDAAMLRPIDDSDLDALFEQMRDPESVRMAAFTA
jgi:hypothetical protein